MLSSRGFLTTGVVALCALLALCTAQLPAQETPSEAAAQNIRYHFGDDPRWANPAFDDSAWSVASQNQWPRPAFYSDGFTWVRFSVPVRSDTVEPLSLRVSSPIGTLLAYDTFVNGMHVGSFGKVPPEPVVESRSRPAIFDLPSGLTKPGAVAQVALRIWYLPSARQPGRFDSFSLTLDQSRLLKAEDVAARQRALLRNLPLIILNSFVLLIGFIVLLLARSSRSRDLLLYGALIFSLPWLTLYFEIADAGLVTLSVPAYYLLQVLSQLPCMIITVEFIWRIHDLKTPWLKRIMFVALILFNTALLLTYFPSQPSWMVTAAVVGQRVNIAAFSGLQIAIYLWVIFIKRQKVLIAFAQALVPVAAMASSPDSGIRITAGRSLMDLAFFLAGLCLSAVLAREAWKEWRERDVLQTEFETAREVQQQLVPPAVDVPGFRIESVYKPARHVGGDFFYIRPEEQDGILIVVGDVSGKGLKAAMTVSSIIGALRTMPTLPLPRILAALNHGLAGHIQGGFVTCCVARIGGDGEVTIANAGHLSPYRDGIEAPVIAGLPLGIDPDAEFEESRFMLKPGGRLTLVSDGIVEARSQSGELFGFERTLQVSNYSAEAIAQTAIDFGQEDDITVLTLTRLALSPEAVTLLEPSAISDPA